MKPQNFARLAGFVYLVVGVTAAFAEIGVRGRMIIRADAAATAAHILAQEFLYRAGGAADVVSVAGDAILAFMFYELLKPVHRGIALLAAFFRLVHVAVLAMSTVFHFAPLSLLLRANESSAFTVAQAQEQALTFLRVQAIGYNVCLVFFGITCLLLGWLLYRSALLPRLIGIFVALAGIGYLLNSFVRFLVPLYGPAVFRYVTVPLGFGELVLILWLLIAGVRPANIVPV